MRRRTLVIGVVLLGGAALVLFCCGGSDRHSAEVTSAPVPADARPATSAAAEGSAGALAPVPGEHALVPVPTDAAAKPAASVAAAPAVSGAAAPTASGPSGTSIVQAVKGSDPRDLEFLASIERELKRDPPPEAHALVAARKRGASRAELASDIQRLPGLELRVLAERWLDKVLPRPR